MPDRDDRSYSNFIARIKQFLDGSIIDDLKKDNKDTREKLAELQVKLQDLENSYRQLAQDNQQQVNTIEGLKGLVHKLLKENHEQRMPNLEDESKSNSDTIIPPPSIAEAKESLEADKVEEVFYLSRPRRDGTFNHNSKTHTFDPSKSAYEFCLIDSDKQLASFKIINNEKNLLLAKSSQDTFIDPACEKQNEVTEHSSSILTEKPGIAHLEDESWIVIEKAVISFQ